MPGSLTIPERVLSHERNNLSMKSIFVCVCSSGTVSFQTQRAGDHLDFTWNTYDPLGCAAVGAPSEVLFLPLAE